MSAWYHAGLASPIGQNHNMISAWIYYVKKLTVINITKKPWHDYCTINKFDLSLPESPYINIYQEYKFNYQINKEYKFNQQLTKTQSLRD